ncbi:uncharacterized protein LOC111393039 [Olea europaea var. sylvestris]|uniref:uncharacterized protein LOC111393039 n=1 Tax=Olea europaea var. sylvestris TaxID=158386 RepID=UPI000C1D55C3|nr:uncharacterized protein LOC111393039 [Olea europaea var. sylvestris]
MFLTPIAAHMRSSIVYPDFGVNNFQIRLDWINLMSNTLEFYRLPQENPNTHISKFLRNCQNFHAPRVNEDAIKLRLFPFTLRDAALEWLDAEVHASITTWEELTRKFCNQVQYFYTRLTPLSKSQVDASARGSILGKSVQQTMDLFELIATTHSMFSSERVAPPKTGRMYKLDSTASTNAQIVALTKQVDLLVKSQTKGAHAVTAGPSCENCGANHLTKNYTSIGYPDKQVNFIQNGSRNFNPFAQMYNPGWRQHPNFRWSNNQQGNSSNNAQQEKKPSLGEMFNQYMQKTDKVFQQINTNFQNQQASIKKLEKQIGQIAQELAKRPQGTLPGNTMVNPKEQVQAITTRSGVQLPEIHVKRPERKEKEIMGEEAGKEVEFEQPTDKENERKETPIVRAPSPVKAYVPPIPFPQRLQRKKLDNQFAKFVEIFKKLHINIPFADAIAQMPSYAKFLTEILSNKRKLEEHETVCLNEECSAILLKKLPPKLKDSGNFTIPCTIVDNEQVIFDVFKAMKHPLTSNTCYQVDVLEELVMNTFDIEHHTNLCEAEFVQLKATNAEKSECVVNLAEQPIGRKHW